MGGDGISFHCLAPCHRAHSHLTPPLPLSAPESAVAAALGSATGLLGLHSIASHSITWHRHGMAWHIYLGP